MRTLYIAYDSNFDELADLQCRPIQWKSLEEIFNDVSCAPVPLMTIEVIYSNGEIHERLVPRYEILKARALWEQDEHERRIIDEWGSLEAAQYSTSRETHFEAEAGR